MPPSPRPLAFNIADGLLYCTNFVYILLMNHTRNSRLLLNKRSFLLPLFILLVINLACGLPVIPQTLPTQPANKPVFTPVVMTPAISTQTLQPSPALATVSTIKLFMIALEDKGISGKAIGCDDSLVPVSIEIPATSGVLRATLEKLLSLRTRDYGESGLYNALYQSDLKLDDVAISEGEAIIHLSGKLQSGGVCDDPRIIAQLTETALQFNTVKRVSVIVNNRPLTELLSGKE